MRQFKIFIDTVEPQGALIYCEVDPELAAVVAAADATVRKIAYEIPDHEVQEGVTWLLPEHTPLNIFGDHNLMNLSAAKHVCTELGISGEEFNLAISSFKGASRRLELIGQRENTNVYKDFAHSPSKLKATIDAVKGQFPDRQLVACIELHTFSSLNKNFLLQYESTMAKADLSIVYIDEKSFKQKKVMPLNRSDIQNAFKDGNLKFFNQIEEVERELLTINFKNTNLLLMSSGNFSGLDLIKLARELKV